jgi:hypothetical protein
VTEPDDRTELLRDGVEMALYIALSLLAVMVALPSALERTETVEVALILIVTAIGLLAAHWLAFRVSARLTTGGLLSQQELAILAAQLAGGAAVVAVAVVPILVLEPPNGLFVAQIALLAVIAGVAYLAARPRAPNRGVAFLYAAAVVAGAAVIVFIKDLVGH